MSDLWDVNPHLALLRSESYVSEYERNWLTWCKDVELLMGLESLDGDQFDDGYSLDYAHDFFVAGMKPREAADEFAASIG